MDTLIKQIDLMPMVKHYIEELKLPSLLNKYVPNKNGAEIDPTQVLCVLVMNIIGAAKPLYQVEEWLGDYSDGIAEPLKDAHKYNDDRIGRNLDLLFYAERDSLLAEVTSNAISVHHLMIDKVHNDTTSISFAGAYEGQSTEAVQLKFGYNKDNRSDCKQIVFGLNITEDGHVPIGYQLFDGNKADVSTHQINWDEIRTLLDKEDFIYVADSKLCSTENLTHIAENGGQFITIMPRNFKEAVEFLEKVRDGYDIDFQREVTLPNSRKINETITYRIHEGETNRDNFRLLWVHSSSKQQQDEKNRGRQIEKASQTLESLSNKINHYNLKTQQQIEDAIKAIGHSINYFKINIVEEESITKIKIGRGRPGPDTKYKDKKTISYKLEWSLDDDAIQRSCRIDGLFPLIDNTQISPEDVLLTYKKQPYLEKRFYTKKSILEVAPVFLKKTERIEAMLFLYFIALMIVSLIERNIRNEMAAQEIDSLPILPSGLRTKTPTWNNLRTFFRNVHLSFILDKNVILKSAIKGLTKVHHLLLRLLKVPGSIYGTLKDDWIMFSY